MGSELKTSPLNPRRWQPEHGGTEGRVEVRAVGRIATARSQPSDVARGQDSHLLFGKAGLLLRDRIAGIDPSRSAKGNQHAPATRR